VEEVTFDDELEGVIGDVEVNLDEDTG